MTCATQATAQENTRPPVLVVEDLLGDDWKAARDAKDELARIGARGVIPLLDARAAATPRANLRNSIDSTLRGIVRVLSEEVGRPLGEAADRVSADGALGGMLGASDRERPDLSIVFLEPNEFGDLGSISAEEPDDWYGKRVLARRARSALVRLGPAATGFLLEVPPILPLGHAQAVNRLLAQIYQNERTRILALKTDKAREAYQGGYRGLADLALPIVEAGLRDTEAAVRSVFQAIRDEVLEGALASLEHDDPLVREAGEDTLFRLGHVARQPLQQILAGKDPKRRSAHWIETATLLVRRIRFSLSRELLRRLGHDLAGYAKLSFRERRAMVFEIERLGGEHAIPTLRTLLKEEASDSVRTVAAIGLFRLGDPTGSQWLALHSSEIPLPQISKRELAAIYMDQGLHYLTLGRFERAERDFKRVIAVEPQNDIAWYNLACTYSRWGKIDEALEHLVKAIEFGFDDASHMSKDPDLDPLRDDPRFKKILADLKGDEDVDPDAEPEGEQDDAGDAE